ncbi:hypothetical protein V6N12_058407 [Hibiscus sabdariffa]|uniref:Uncharacterized protein n=1 Tax=Hibiscus sabdariffa TaxID=183260 RepID=A0ABR2ES16_9ROSI
MGPPWCDTPYPGGSEPPCLGELSVRRRRCCRCRDPPCCRRSRVLEILAMGECNGVGLLEQAWGEPSNNLDEWANLVWEPKSWKPAGLVERELDRA